MPDDKKKEYYAAQANAWFNTRLEYDKSLLVLSAGAIGLLVTLLTTVGVETFTLLYIYIGSLICFIICLFSVLTIFFWNSKHLEDLIAGKKTYDSLLAVLDKISIVTFIIGIILASIIGLYIAFNEVI